MNGTQVWKIVYKNSYEIDVLFTLSIINFQSCTISKCALFRPCCVVRKRGGKIYCIAVATNDGRRLRQRPH